MKKLIISGAIFLLLGVSYAAFADVTAYEHSISQLFSKEIAVTVNRILQDSEIKTWSQALAWFLGFITIGWSLVTYIKESEIYPFVYVCILFFIFWFLYASYEPIVSGFMDLFIALGGSMYKAAMGNVSGDQIIEAVKKAVSMPTTDIFDSIDILMVAFLWELAVAFLSMAVYFADIFVIVGGSLAKIVGILFLPFIICPWTHGAFNKWCSFFAVFGVFSIFLKITSIIVMVVMRVSINFLATDGVDQRLVNVLSQNFTVQQVLTITDDTAAIGMTAIAYVAVCVALVFMSFSLAKQCVGNINAGGGVSRGAQKMARVAIKALL
ncbi:hypothetical protein CKG00_18465 [Morganella morganii]|uniref:TrbL/VirB6 plasmid conjugal transfer protein n=1 Tax=Morganella morganii TaxID=582 RepID=A0A433ZPR0_MORMO|nr:hypothetical protein [Morganella morganii]RUT64115.1 hypothetical protein CKG00_18465 [Morganella morganii]